MVVLPPLFAQNNKLNNNNNNNQLPSIKTICQDVLIEKPKENNKHLLPSLLNNNNYQHHRRNHFRTSSMPTRLMEPEPSLLTSVKKEEERLSMEVLLKAISLEQKMNASFKKERVKNFVREQQWLHKVNMNANHQGFVIKKKNQLTSSMARRRSRSAPGAPLAHYYHNASLNPTRWYLPKNHSDSDHYKSTHDIAQAIVQQHLKAVFEKKF